MRKIANLFQEKFILMGTLAFAFLLMSSNSFGQLTASISDQTDVLCFGESTGVLVIAASGGTEPYDYKIDDGEYQESNTFENLAAGTYEITVMDDASDTFVLSAEITEPTELTIVIADQVNVECEGYESGELDVTVSGGTETYTYAWTTSDGFGLEAAAEDQTGLGEGTYILIVTDANGCVADLSATITHVGETTPPTIIGGTNGTAECVTAEPGENPDYIAWRDAFAGTTAVDDCGVKSLVYDENNWETQDCIQQTTLLILAADNNDNTATRTFTFTIVDTTPPELTGGADGSAETTGTEPGLNETYIAWRDNFAGITAVDPCGEVNMAWDEGVWTTEGNTDIITVHFIASNPCGLITIITYDFTIINSNDPVITCPGDISVECASDVPAPDISEVTATGNNVTVTHVEDVSDGNTCPEIISRTYRATDEDDNFSECTQLITIHDITAPVISCPGPITVGSLEEVPDVDLELVSSTDNCSESITILHLSDDYDESNCTGILTRTYMAVDDCGNANSCTQLITVEDNSPPTIICPADMEVLCISDVPAVDVSQVTAADNCGPITVTHIEDVSDGNTCPETIFRVFNAVDERGNISECTQIITVNDTMPPVLVGVPEDITVDCENIPDPPTVTATDNCTPDQEVDIQYIELANDVENCKGAIVRQWIATDACGNSVSNYQTIIVDPVTGIDDISFTDGLNVYPNPSHGEFTLTYLPESAGRVMMQVMDISGKIVFNESYHSNGSEISESVQVPNRTKGIYFIRLTTDTKVVYRKVVVE